MKLLVFAHVPPPHHGQSYMVQLMLEGLGGDQRGRKTPGASSPHEVECYHVNFRLSRHLEDLGEMRIGKLFLLFFYCLQAIWIRFRYGVENFYYVPAPGKTAALIRDWLVMLMCRPFFKRVVFHWHSAGLAKWLETTAQMHSRVLSYHLMKQADLSIVLSKFNRADAEKFFPRQITVVNNGIPDPCPDFEETVLPARRKRFEARRRLATGERFTLKELELADNPQIVRVLYLAHCGREKGTFDAMKGVVLANERMAAQGSPISLRLTIAGDFASAEDRTEFERLMANPAFSHCISYVGFVTGKQKEQLLRDSGVFCFPTFFPNENQPVSLIEAMAFGLSVVTTRWRSVPEILPKNYPGLVDVNSTEQIANALLQLMTEDGEALRHDFLRKFTVDKFLSGLASAFHNMEPNNMRPARAPVPQYEV
jgi:glycosyltransferase involved in cell wall biosynthesis